MEIKNLIVSSFAASIISFSPAIAANLENTKKQVYECLVTTDSMEIIFSVEVKGQDLKTMGNSIKYEKEIKNSSDLEDFLQSSKGVGIYFKDKDGKPIKQNPRDLRSVECVKLKNKL